MTPNGEPVLLEQLAEGPQATGEALGVIEPIDAEQDPLRVAQALAYLPCPVDHLRVGRHPLEGGGVDADAEGLHPDRAPTGFIGEAHVGTFNLGVGDQRGQASEVGGTALGLKPDDVGAEKPLGNRASPRQLEKQLDRWKRDVEKEADAQIGS